MLGECFRLKVPFKNLTVTVPVHRLTELSHIVVFLKLTLCTNECLFTKSAIYNSDLRLDSIVKSSKDLAICNNCASKIGVHLYFSSSRFISSRGSSNTESEGTGNSCECHTLLIVASLSNSSLEVSDLDCATSRKKSVVSRNNVVSNCLCCHVSNLLTGHTNNVVFESLSLLIPFFNNAVTVPVHRLTELSHVVIVTKFHLGLECLSSINSSDIHLVLNCIDTAKNDLAILVKNYCSNSSVNLCGCSIRAVQINNYAHTELVLSCCGGYRSRILCLVIIATCYKSEEHAKAKCECENLFHFLKSPCFLFFVFVFCDFCVAEFHQRRFAHVRMRALTHKNRKFFHIRKRLYHIVRAMSIVF